MIYTTLNKIRRHHPCTEGWQTLLTSLGKTKADDEPLPMVHILESNGLNDTLWCLRTLPEYDDLWRLYAVWCARQVQHLMQDKRSLKALDVAEKYAKGGATKEELRTASDAASSAAREASFTARDATAAATWAAAWTTTSSTSRSTLWATTWAIRATARDASSSSASSSTRAAARAAQKAELRRILEEGG